jgi:hypothetical protein
MTSTRIQWIRVRIGGFLAEASVFTIVIPIFMISGQRAQVYAAPSASLVMCFLSLSGSGDDSNHASSCTECWSELSQRCFTWGSFWLALNPIAYLVAHGLKVLGGAGGGAFAGCDERLRPPQMWHHIDIALMCPADWLAAGGELEQIQFLLGHISIQPTERYLG